MRLITQVHVCFTALVFGYSGAVVQASLYLPRDGEVAPLLVEEYVAPRKWGSPVPGTPASVTYSFVVAPNVKYNESGFPGFDGKVSSVSSFMPTGALDEIRKAFAAWSAVTNITFTEIADSGNNYGSAGDANIRVGGHHFDGASGVLAHAFTSYTDSSPLDTIDFTWIDFDSQDNWTVESLDGDTSTIDIFQVAAHEIGHAIGLGHEETNLALMNPFYSESFAGLQLDDIMGAQFLYGVVAVPESAWIPFLASSLLGLTVYVQKRRHPPRNWAKNRKSS